MNDLLICMSGGRTSAHMTKKLLDEYGDKYNIIVCFANTGQENDKTLDFVNQCDKEFGFNTVWLEAVVHNGRTACTHKVVTYETASREGEPFIEMAKKYGIPNKGYPHCTRELKENSIHSYIAEIGWEKGEYETALGMRIDEPKRVLGQKVINIFKKYCEIRDLEEMMEIRFEFIKRLNDSKEHKKWDVSPISYASEYIEDLLVGKGALYDDLFYICDYWSGKNDPQNKIYPLVDFFPADKLDVMDFWGGQSFDLGLHDYQGNCTWCYKKSTKKHFQLLSDDLSSFDFPDILDKKYGHNGNNKINGVLVDFDRTIFRNYMTAEKLKQLYLDTEYRQVTIFDNEAQEGCAESCEPFAS